MNGTDADTVRAALPILHPDNAECGCSTCEYVRSVHASLDALVRRAADAEKALQEASGGFNRIRKMAGRFETTLADIEQEARDSLAAALSLSSEAAAASGDGQPPGDFYPSDWAG